jgi:hypothetical protein
MASTATTVTNPAIDEVKKTRQKSRLDPFWRDDHPSASPAIPTPIPPSSASRTVPRWCGVGALP